MLNKTLKIGDLPAVLPIIQGGMGVGVSRCNLAGAVAKAGGIGIISTAQIGYDEPDFEKEQISTNLKAIKKHIKKAKEIANGNGLVGVNIMVATKQYEKYVREAAGAGADVIISGAGLPIDLPAYVKGTKAKIAPVVSSIKAIKLLLKMWDKKAGRTADFIVIEGARAGGHLGFAKEEVENFNSDAYEEEIKGIIKEKQLYEEKYSIHIPVIVAGGIFDYADIKHVMEIGADGAQIATRFVVTEECDASQEYKDAYIKAEKEDIQIVLSPVGMPGRAIGNSFMKKTKEGKVTIKKCYNCLEKCNPATIPYCITKALINAVDGHINDGLIFCGDNVDKLKKMTTVPELMKELAGA